MTNAGQRLLLDLFPGLGMLDTSGDAAQPNTWDKKGVPVAGPFTGHLAEYWIDASQRWLLFLDTLRERGNEHFAYNAAPAPHVLTFEAELVRDGRTLARPVNYLLMRIVPPVGTKIDLAKPPFIVFDPRAGHGPGIGGMKKESEIGVALAAGHPCYFVSFLPAPVPGQTIEDVCHAEADFVAEVAARHANADGKPVLIGNCQAGWQIMMMAALHPDLAGPIMLAGSPLSYWAGVRGKNPLRYLGGILGGTWLTAMAGHLGHGMFDGASLVANFEMLNPANTFWQKAYNLYSEVDTQRERFLSFETWWGSPVLMNAGEMQWIADNLFVGNRLAPGVLRSSDGVRIDLRNIRSPIIVFCSWGDDITPPQQALGWISDLYDHEREIVANGQTIVYTLHQSIGHLGIFVSGKVATKETSELAGAMELINALPPGLYEAVITEAGRDLENAELVTGRYLLQIEARTLDDIRTLISASPEDDRRFETVSRVSEVNRSLYDTFVGPWVRLGATEHSADMLRRTHPNRVRFEWFSDRNPAIRPVKLLAEQARQNRRPVSPDNPWLQAERTVSEGIAWWLDRLGEARDAWTEQVFLAAYGSPLLQAMVGLGPNNPGRPQRAERDLAREASAQQIRRELEGQYAAGGLAEAVLRSILYVRLPGRRVDERGFAALQAIRAVQPAEVRLTAQQLRDAVRIQFLLLTSDPRRATAAIPKLLPGDKKRRQLALDAIRRVVTAAGDLGAEERSRLAEIEGLFGSGATASPAASEAADA